MMRYQDFIGSSSKLQEEVMDDLFEPSEGLQVLTLKNNEFMSEAGSLKSYSEFIELVRSTLLQTSVRAEREGEQELNLLVDVVGAHPRLGEPKLKLSRYSQAEQQNLQQSHDPPYIKERLAQLNAEYERLYPQLKFVVFVNGRTRPEIIKVMESRISSKRPWFEECRQAIHELCNIAQDRIRQSMF
ncbi:uncharacterized protein ZBIST_2653 [Zygosaccharomyces bailii]|nr:uncharacterized protein ZBIST_2653 [Zygosaccharomyces bailii]